MKKIIKFFAVLLFTFTLAACNNAQSPIDDLKSMIEKLAEDSDDYTSEDWDEIEAEFDKISEELEKYEGEYTDEQKKEIGRLKGKCAAIIWKKAVKQAGEAIEEYGSQMESVMDGFMEELSEE